MLPTVALAGVALLLSACTVVNTAVFTIDSPAAPERLLEDVERYFMQLGLAPQEKVDFEYPERRKERRYLLRNWEHGFLNAHRTHQYVVLRLEKTGSVYLDWVEISSTKRVPKAGEFDPIHSKMTHDLRSKFGIELRFVFVEAK